MQVYIGAEDGKFTPLGDVFYLDDVNSEQVAFICHVVTCRSWISGR